MGSFKCLCDDGYSLKGDLEDGCTDDDECLLDLYHCDPMAECKNTNGTYECICREGFTGDGFDCHVIFDFFFLSFSFLCFFLSVFKSYIFLNDF